MRIYTIRIRPSISAIKPPVLVPPIKSKYSHGNGVSAVRFRLPISSISCRRIRRDDNPRTPPPSSDRIRGQDIPDIVEGSTYTKFSIKAIAGGTRRLHLNQDLHLLDSGSLPKRKGAQ